MYLLNKFNIYINLSLFICVVFVILIIMWVEKLILWYGNGMLIYH